MFTFGAFVELVFLGDFGLCFMVFGFAAEPSVCSDMSEVTESFGGDSSLFNVVYTLSTVGQDRGWEVSDVNLFWRGIRTALKTDTAFNRGELEEVTTNYNLHAAWCYFH